MLRHNKCEECTVSPASHWVWINESGQLFLEMGEGERCALLFPSSCLNLFASRTAFTCEHTEVFNQYSERLDRAPIALSEAQRLYILLHATAAAFFHKPVPLKSWWVETASRPASGEKFGVLQSQTHQGLVFVMEQHKSSATVMLLNNGFVTNTQKSLPAFSLLHVSNDRLSTAVVPQQRKSA